MATQLSMFGEPEIDTSEPASKRIVVEPAMVTDDVTALAGRLSPLIHMGTSSWNFPGWRKLVWSDRDYSEHLLAQRGLLAYAKHPLLRSVGLDRTHYAPVTTDVMANYGEQVPADFRFLVKAHEACTLAVYPTHARYGNRRGAANPQFLDASYARDMVVAPFVEGLGERGGPLLFQFAAQPMAQLGGTPRRFAEQLYRFLRDLPRGPMYAVEIRNRALLTRDYAAALRSAGALHCYNVLPDMPTPSDQQAVVDPNDEAHALVMRWLLAKNFKYEEAREAFRPFNRIALRDDDARTEISQFVERAIDRKRAAYVIVNNKAEGSAPESVAALARRLAKPH